MIDKLKAKHSVQMLCSQLNVSVSGYCSHRHKPASPRQQEDLRLTIAIKAAHARGRGIYGPKKIQAELAAQGIYIGVNRIKRQYCSKTYRTLQASYKMQTLMSRKGDYWDNAPMESFFGTLKTECLHHYKFKTRDEAKCVSFEYIKLFYNRIRRHAKLKNQIPDNFAKTYMQNTEKNAA